MESKQTEVDLEQALLTWRNWSGERVNNQNKWVFRIMFGLMGVITIGALIGFLLSCNII